VAGSKDDHFGCIKRSAFGARHQYGPDALKFDTKARTVTARWFSGIKNGAPLNFKALAQQNAGLSLGVVALS
jgi:hypothetical protein